jgi:hypothetical protein
MLNIQDIKPGKLYQLIDNNASIYSNKIETDIFDCVSIHHKDIVLVIEVLPLRGFRSKHQIKVLFKERVGYMFGGAFQVMKEL